MGFEDIAICSMCQMTLNSQEEVLEHKCIDIKEEKIDFEDLICDEKDKCDLSKNDSDYSPTLKKSKKTSAKKSKVKEVESNEKLKDYLKKRERSPKNDGFEGQLKVATKKLQVYSSNIELSEQFIVLILKQVDELCENISNGDPDIKRSSEINENLVNAVNSYRNIHNFGKELFDKIECHDDIMIESENKHDPKDIFQDSNVKEPKVPEKCPICNASFSSQMSKRTANKHINKCEIESTIDPLIKDPLEDVFPDSKVPGEKVKEPKEPEENRKMGKRNKTTNEEDIKKIDAQRSKLKQEVKFGRPTKNADKFELVKNQCGRHKLSEMAFLLDIPISSLSQKLKVEGIKFTKELVGFVPRCKLCDMKESNEIIKKDQLLQYLKFNSDTDQFECCFCNYSVSVRSQMYTHIRKMHRKEVITKTTEPQNNQDCHGSLCKKLYGSIHTKLWCQKCSKELPEFRKKQKKEPELCPDCGKSVPNLTNHQRLEHSNKKSVCDICSREYKNSDHLYDHKRAVHEKVPCTECGKLIGLKLMKRHINLAHTPNDQKKFRCDTCGKGFVNNRCLLDHINTHTGAKPYLCKYCSMGFASGGTHLMHEKNHIGRGRVYKK